MTKQKIKQIKSHPKQTRRQPKKVKIFNLQFYLRKRTSYIPTGYTHVHTKSYTHTKAHIVYTQRAPNTTNKKTQKNGQRI